MKLSGRKQRTMVSISVLHAFWLMLLSFFLLNWHFVHWDEGELIQFGPILKKLVLEIEQKPSQDELMFINVSNSNSLVDFFDEETFTFGNETITNRLELAGFLDTLAETPNHKAILIDIRFDISSDDDEVLQTSFDKTQRILVSNHITDGKPDSPVFDVPTGISDYPIVGGSFFKFQYFYQDTIKTIPILLDELVSKKEYNKGKYLISDGRSRFYNIFLTDLLIRPHDVFTSEDHYYYADLGAIRLLNSEELSFATRDKIIVIGDFEKYDMHETLLGTMPGPLVLLNSFYTLNRGVNKLTWYSLTYIFICYLVLSLIIFIPGDPLEFWLKKISGSSQIASALAGIFSYFLLLILTVLTTYLFFDFLLNILWLTFYLYIIDKVVTKIYKSKGIIESE